MNAQSYVGRLAPSPTGLLHLGHARTFWIAYQRARAAKGTLYLRDEDLDSQRCRAEFAVTTREDLHWLGIEWDTEFRQSERFPLYRSVMQQLLESGSVYPCTCSRRDLALATQAPHEGDDEPLYSNRCRSSQPSRQFDPHANYRFRTPDHEIIRFNDLQAGPQSFTTAVDFGDFLVWRKAFSSDQGDIGLPSYQLACVVDDALTNVSEVVRGRDLLKSTARQILLQRALFFPTPDYLHCDLVRDTDGMRLAKRHDALSLRALREEGRTPSEILALF